MKRFMIIIVVFPIFTLSLVAERIDRWANLRYLIGTWKIENPKVTNTQHFSFLFNGQFIQMKTRAVFKPTAKKPKGEIHEEQGLFSYDSMSNKLVLRSFHSEGFVNTYHLTEISKDGNTLTFMSVAVENAPAGTRAKLIFQKINDRELIQKFLVAWPDKEYTCFSDNHLKKLN